MPIDPETWLKVSSTLERVQRSGWDPAEELDRLRLLLTPERRLDLRVQALQQLLDQLSVWRPAELLRRKFHAGHQSSPSDMYTVILEFIEEYRNKVKEEG